MRRRVERVDICEERSDYHVVMVEADGHSHRGDRQRLHQMENGTCGTLIATRLACARSGGNVGKGVTFTIHGIRGVAVVMQASQAHIDHREEGKGYRGFETKAEINHADLEDLTNADKLSLTHAAADRNCVRALPRREWRGRKMMICLAWWPRSRKRFVTE
jgi:hypothetical protein